jgi:NAD(P)-dependent dehydrogenase (short-subunit alcohol dehydrogenase family)
MGNKIKIMKNKIVVITGAGSGIGRALAIEYGGLGAKLALNDFNESDLNETVSILKEKGIDTVFPMVFDVADKTAMIDFATQVKSKWSNASIVINNAGISGFDTPGYLIKEHEYRRVMDVNFFGVLNGCQAFLPQLVENNEGAIVNISSTFGMIGAVNNSDYCASKFAVRGYTECLAAEFKESPITIHCVHPGGIDTRIDRDANTKAFAEIYLKTPPHKIAKHITKSVRQKKVKIVYGHGSLRIWIVANLVPQKLANWIIWRESKKIIDLNAYRTFIKSL